MIHTNHAVTFIPCCQIFYIRRILNNSFLGLGQDWNAESNEKAIAVIKIKLNMIDKLQEKTLYEGQSDYYKNLQWFPPPIMAAFFIWNDLTNKEEDNPHKDQQ